MYFVKGEFNHHPNTRGSGSFVAKWRLWEGGESVEGIYPVLSMGLIRTKLTGRLERSRYLGRSLFLLRPLMLRGQLGACIPCKMRASKRPSAGGGYTRPLLATTISVQKKVECCPHWCYTLLIISWKIGIDRKEYVMKIRDFKIKEIGTIQIDWEKN